MTTQLPAIQKAFDLAKELVVRAAKFPNSYKYVVGDRIMGHVLDIQDLLVKARYSKSKAAFLDEANTRLEQLRFLLRLADELGGLSHKGYGHVSKMVDARGEVRFFVGWSNDEAERRVQIERLERAVAQPSSQP